MVIESQTYMVSNAAVLILSLIHIGSRAQQLIDEEAVRIDDLPVKNS